MENVKALLLLLKYIDMKAVQITGYAHGEYDKFRFVKNFSHVPCLYGVQYAQEHEKKIRRRW